jgi:hypothetical protein
MLSLSSIDSGSDQMRMMSGSSSTATKAKAKSKPKAGSISDDATRKGRSGGSGGIADTVLGYTGVNPFLFFTIALHSLFQFALRVVHVEIEHTID